MLPVDEELSCSRYTVRTCAQGPDRDALLATPIGVALLAARLAARRRAQMCRALARAAAN